MPRLRIPAGLRAGLEELKRRQGQTGDYVDLWADRDSLGWLFLDGRMVVVVLTYGGPHFVEPEDPDEIRAFVEKGAKSTGLVGLLNLAPGFRPARPIRRARCVGA